MIGYFQIITGHLRDQVQKLQKELGTTKDELQQKTEQHKHLQANLVRFYSVYKTTLIGWVMYIYLNHQYSVLWQSEHISKALGLKTTKQKNYLQKPKSINGYLL